MMLGLLFVLCSVHRVLLINGISPDVLRANVDDAEGDALSLISLSSRVSLPDPLSALSDAGSLAASRLQRSLPFAWIHVPKCGSSINNFLIHLPGVCPGVPPTLVISSDTMGEEHNEEFKERYKPLDNSGACGPNFNVWAEHIGAGPKWEELYQGHAVIMLRQPEQRLLSAYHYAQDPLNKTDHHSWPLDRPPRDEREFAEVVQGCAVRMITGGGKLPEENCGNGTAGPPSDAEVKLAVHRVRTGMAFVGITDQWAMSICLGHKMFGGVCRFSDFVDGRVTDRASGGPSKTKVGPTKPYDLSPLRGFTDKYDGELYAAALEVFEEAKRKYGATPASCQACFDEAGVEVELP